MITVTGASGQLGRLVIEELLQQLPPAQIRAAVRNPDRVRDLAARGIEVRYADYSLPETLDAALQGTDKLLLISSSEVGRRFPQHKAVIDAAKRVGVKFLVYTSILHADDSPMGLAREHRETEALVKSSGIDFVLLRNGWYTENYTAGIAAALQHGVLLGSAADGLIASAARADYAAAAATVLTRADQAGRVYELAGDASYTLTDLAAEISRQTGKTVTYQNLPEAAFKAALLDAGVPEAIAGLLAESDIGASKGGLFDDARQLGQLIGRPTTPLATMVKAVL